MVASGHIDKVEGFDLPSVHLHYGGSLMIDLTFGVSDGKAYGCVVVSQVGHVG